MNTFKCLNCGKEKEKERQSSKSKYCGHECQLDFQYQKRVKDFKDGKYIGKHIKFPIRAAPEYGLHWARKMLAEEKGYKCNSCGLSEWQGESITLDVNHIDGHAYNNTLENLEFLCPNCHSQTNTYSNKGSRKSDRSYRRKTE